MTAAVALARYRFGSFELQPDERRLLFAGVPVHLGPHAFDLLVVLAERSGRLITKDELLARVWGKVVVEENTLQAHIVALRKILGHQAIATVTGKGYRFTSPVMRIDLAPVRRTDNLPYDLTSFIGREKELAELARLLQSARLLTLTGAGGCGKTRLAIQLARQQVQGYRDGAWLVELAALSDPGLVGQTIANALDIKEQAGNSLVDALCDSLAARHLLLILDNAEHLLDGCAQVADELLQRCARLSILCTSRERLGITGEAAYRVPSLEVPDARNDTTPERIAACESVRLFVERARLQRPDFALTPGNAAALASICRRLDGIALAIELAAPRVRSMSMQELSTRLDERFGLLTEGSRTALPRHRTLRSLIDWSYELLSEGEKTMLRRVSVFSGGWSLEAVQQVCCFGEVAAADALQVLTSLADKSLVLAETHSEVTRFGLLETVRHYGRERLQSSGEEMEVRRRHLDYFLALAEEGREHEVGPDAPAWLSRLDMEHDNFRGALRASCRDQLDHGEGALRLAGLLQWLWIHRSYLSEARNWASMALSAASGSKNEEARARALRGLGAICQLQGDIASAKQSYEQALAIETMLGKPDRICVALYNLANVTNLQGQLEEAIALYERSMAIARDINDRPMVAVCMGGLSRALYWKGDVSAARACIKENVAICRELGDWRASHALCFLATLTHADGDCRSAAALAGEALAIERNVGDRLGMSASLVALAAARIDMNDTESTVSLVREAVGLWHELGDPDGLCEALRLCAIVSVALQGPIVAARIWGHAEALSPSHPWARFLPGRAWNERHVAAARATLGNDAAFDRAWEEGRATGLEDGVQYALAVMSTGTSHVSPSHSDTN